MKTEIKGCIGLIVAGVAALQSLTGLDVFRQPEGSTIYGRIVGAPYAAYDFVFHPDLSNIYVVCGLWAGVLFFNFGLWLLVLMGGPHLIGAFISYLRGK